LLGFVWVALVLVFGNQQCVQTAFQPINVLVSTYIVLNADYMLFITYFLIIQDLTTINKEYHSIPGACDHVLVHLACSIL